MWLSLKSYTHVLVCFFINVTTCPKLQSPSSSKLFFNLFAISYPSFNPISNPVCIDEDGPEAFTYTLVSPNFYSLYSLEDCIGFIKTYYYAHVLKHSINVSKMSKNTNVDDKLSSLIIHLQSKRTLPFLQSNFKSV